MTVIESNKRLSQIACTALKGVGPAVAEKLARCGIGSLQDLLFHLPLRYEDRTRLYPLASVIPGQQVMIEGKITQVQRPMGGKTRLLCQMADDTGYIQLRFFYVNRAQYQAFSPGTRLRAYGEARFGPKGLEIVHPEYTVMRTGQVIPAETHLTPVYPTTEGLHQATFRKLMKQVLRILEGQGVLDELLPSAVRESLSMPSLKEALMLIHYPPVEVGIKALLSDKHPCQQRLVFEELLAHRLSLLRLREVLKGNVSKAFPESASLKEQFLKVLPFALTNAQERVCQEIEADLVTTRPMMRLVQGDVGSGKTVVAAIAAMQAIEAGYQVCVMAPTDILASQHHVSFSAWFDLLGIPVIYLSGKLTAKLKREASEKITSTKACVVVGTHALFQDGVVFNKLGLVIIDEQHRFGVDQRLRLQQKGVEDGSYPHQLIMTATPIPRTLAMTAFADLDNSIIDELPPGRQPVKTVLLSNARRDEIIERVRESCEESRQVYWVCTLIEESDVLQCQAAEECLEHLKSSLPDLRVGLVHGRLKPSEKHAVMQSFKDGQLDVLVATTVIEVGVDVPNATIMVIENAERLGLSQLHQLRGRVGRGSQKSFCVLLYQTPLSDVGKQRLEIMRDFDDGFIVAEKDLEMRGPGEVLGVRQTGVAAFRIADIVRDQHLLPAVQRVAKEMYSPSAACVTALIDRWLGDRDQYGQV